MLGAVAGRGAPTGEYAPVPDLVTTEEVTFRESFEMSPEDTHEYWSDPTIFNNADTFNYTSPDGAIGEQSADRPTGAYIEPTDGMEIGENGNGPGDVATAQEFEPDGLAKNATGRLYIAFGDQFNFVCSATVVNSRTGNVVATAAHCLVDTETGELAKNALFVPDDYDNGRDQPHGAWSAVDMVVPSTFIDGVKKSNTDIEGDGWTYDFGFLVMEEQDGSPIQEVTGAMGIAFGVPTKTLISTGYPAAGQFDGSKRFFCSTTGFEHGRFGGYYWPCNMTPGMSGGGVFAYSRQRALVRVPRGGELARLFRRRRPGRRAPHGVCRPRRAGAAAVCRSRRLGKLRAKRDLRLAGLLTAVVVAMTGCASAVEPQGVGVHDDVLGYHQSATEQLVNEDLIEGLGLQTNYVAVGYKHGVASDGSTLHVQHTTSYVDGSYLEREANETTGLSIDSYHEAGSDRIYYLFGDEYTEALDIKPWQAGPAPTSTSRTAPAACARAECAQLRVPDPEVVELHLGAAVRRRVIREDAEPRAAERRRLAVAHDRRLAQRDDGVEHVHVLGLPG